MTATGFLRDILIDNRQNAAWNIRRIFRIADPRKSWQWRDSETYYSDIDVKEKKAMVLGSDYGITPMYLIERGAKSVMGFSLWKQYFFNSRYTHRVERFTMEKIKGIDFDVLVADCEGCEYLLTKDFLSSLSGYVICFHDPIENQKLFDYVKSESVCMAPPTWSGEGKKEISVFRRS